MEKSERNELFMQELIKPENWNPRISRIARKSHLPTTTVWDRVKSMRKDMKLGIQIEGIRRREVIYHCIKCNTRARLLYWVEPNITKCPDCKTPQLINMERVEAKTTPINEE